MKLSPKTLKTLAAVGAVGAIVVAEWPQARPLDKAELMPDEASIYEPNLWEQTVDGYYFSKHWVLVKLRIVPPRAPCGMCGMG